MRTALAAASVLAATSLVGLGTAPAQAAGCEAHSPGVTISNIVLGGGLSCDHAKQVIHHAMTSTQGMHTIGWTCRHYGSHHIPYSCWANNHSGHWVSFFVVVGDGSGPGGF